MAKDSCWFLCRSDSPGIQMSRSALFPSQTHTPTCTCNIFKYFTFAGVLKLMHCRWQLPFTVSAGETDLCFTRVVHQHRALTPQTNTRQVSFSRCFLLRVFMPPSCLFSPRGRFVLTQRLRDNDCAPRESYKCKVFNIYSYRGIDVVVLNEWKDIQIAYSWSRFLLFSDMWMHSLSSSDDTYRLCIHVSFNLSK